MSDLNREVVADALGEYREYTDRSRNLDCAAISMVRNLGQDDDLMSSLIKQLYALQIVDDIGQTIELDKLEEQNNASS